MKKLQLVILILLATSACASKVDNHGYISMADVKSQVTAGETTRDEVRDRLGSPSAQSSYGAESWYYISSQQEGVGFMKPEVVEQYVIRIQFDTEGKVSDIRTYNKNDSKDFDLVKRTTPTEGHSMGFFEQILGNIGRFNRPTDDTVAPGRKPH